jgi:hypothetical protein
MRHRSFGKLAALLVATGLTLLGSAASVTTRASGEEDCESSTEVNPLGHILCNPGACQSETCQPRTYDSPNGTTYTWCRCTDPTEAPWLSDTCHRFVYEWIGTQILCTAGDCAPAGHECKEELGTAYYKTCVCR